MKKIIAVSFAAVLAASASTAFASKDGGLADRYHEATSYPHMTGK